MLEHFFKSQVATISDLYQCNRIMDALAAAGIKFYCKTSSIAKPEISIVAIRLIRREWVL